MENNRLIALKSLAMRITIAQIFILLFVLTSNANELRGQEILDKTISLKVEKMKLKSVLSQIQALTDAKFVFSSVIIDANRKVSYTAKNEKVSEVLLQLLAPMHINFRVIDDEVILYTGNGTQIDFYGIPVHGRITDAAGNPLVGATVSVKGTTVSTLTDAKGVYVLNEVDSKATITISYVGYNIREMAVNGKSELNASLEENRSSLNEVIVVGYGTQKRMLVTGAVSSVSGKTLNEVPVTTLSQALQGRVAGVTVTNNGSPGTEPIVRIRGISSISYASDPLYVVDGFPTGDLATIDLKDIESVDVLKDASAAAIYGSAATNGVVMITTKKGRRDSKINISLDSYFGTQEVTKRLSLLNTQQFEQYAIAYRGSQVPRLLAPHIDEPVYTGATQTYGQTNTNWQDAYFKTGAMTGHNIGLSGGNEMSRFHASAGYMDQKGIAPSVGYRRYNFRINSDHIISKMFTFGENLYAASGEQAYDNNETGSRTNLVNVIRMMPHMPVYDPTSNGGYRGVDATLDGGDPTNPVEDAALKNPGKRTTEKIFGTAYLDINFTKWLKFKSAIGVDYANGLDYRFAPIFNDNGAIAGSSATLATITNNRSVSTVLLYTEQLSFDKTFGNHHINAIAVYEERDQKTRQENESGNQASNQLKTLNNATNPSAQTLIGENALLSYLGRVNYDFKGKYLLSAAIRRDGLSVWAPGKKWATFPSASIGWRIDQEDFMKSQAMVSELKLRAGYGLTGLNGLVLGNTPWLVSVNSNSAYYPFNGSNTSGPASSIQRLGNKDLEWEKTKQVNIGLDLGLLKNKFTVTLEYYQRKTDNLILGVPLPPSFGYINSTVSQNVGSMQNSGFEAQLGYNKREGNFKWWASANLSFVTNKVTKLAAGVTNIEAGEIRILVLIISQIPRLATLSNPSMDGRWKAFFRMLQMLPIMLNKQPEQPLVILNSRTMIKVVQLM